MKFHYRNSSSADATKYRNSTFEFVLLIKKNEEKTSKVAYFSKLAAQIAQRVAFILSNVAYMPTVYKTELIPNET